ncbi:probable 28S rRNA (cytosine-C(5))-methyltransferase isoform X1 [Formica exsecta]|uniref:probable 28S rRNA (cytosine-C(5))-methyltransferase isoform X1 n=2 Tax=Formica exsecta TaxID=72781 RepID=UPI001143A642|nr:probable 28S rRNA (cytosine-C(5))-methyltransferase isoform X1 [Formica exsecta]
MSTGFVHSVKVPRIYKFTADIVRRVQEDGASLKTLIYEKNHSNIAGIYGLSMNTLRMLPHLDQLFHKTHILTEQPRLDPWLASVLITELLWGKKCLKSHSKPVLTVLAYEKKLQEELKNLNYIETFISHKEKVQKPRYVRVNTLLLSVEKAISFFQKEGWQLLCRSTTYSSYLQTLSQLSESYFIQDFHIPEVLAFPPLTSFHEHSGYQNGELILQDKASCLPAHLLNPVSGSTVLDMCAAPGMKATHIAAKLQNNGEVYAVEIDVKRFETLFRQIRTTHSFCVKPLNQDVLTLDPKQYSHVEYILVDPSCSGSGIVDRPEQSNINNKSLSKRLQNLQSFQAYLLRYALLNFPNAKRIIYSTCSLYPEENEEVIDEVLADIGNAYCLVPAQQLLKNNWINFSSKRYNCGDKCLYSKPNLDFCNGFFVAVFERNFDVALPECKRKGGNVNSTIANLDIKKIDMVKKVECTQKQREKGIKKRKGEISTNDGQVKISRNVVEFVVSQVENKIENEIKTKRNKKDIGKIDNCSLSNFNQEEIILNRPENIQIKISEDMKQKKSGKKRKSKKEKIICDK